jgi:hypothetical protein
MSSALLLRALPVIGSIRGTVTPRPCRHAQCWTGTAPRAQAVRRRQPAHRTGRQPSGHPLPTSRRPPRSWARRWRPRRSPRTHGLAGVDQLRRGARPRPDAPAHVYAFLAATRGSGRRPQPSAPPWRSARRTGSPGSPAPSTTSTCGAPSRGCAAPRAWAPPRRCRCAPRTSLASWRLPHRTRAACGIERSCSSASSRRHIGIPRSTSALRAMFTRPAPSPLGSGEALAVGVGEPAHGRVGLGDMA